MLFWCLWRNVETSCHSHKHFVVCRHQETPPLTTSNKCHNLLRSGGAVLIIPSRSQRWHHAMKPDIGSELRFLPTPPAFDAPVSGGSLSECCYAVWHRKLEWWLYPSMKTFWWYAYSFWHNLQTHRQTHRQTPHDGIGRAAKISPRALTLLIFAVGLIVCSSPQPEHESMMSLLSFSLLSV